MVNESMNVPRTEKLAPGKAIELDKLGLFSRPDQKEDVYQ
jgi:hypothetical protein